MKRYFIGFVLGVGVILLFVLGGMATGSPFRTTPVKYGTWKGGTVVTAPDFIVVYENVACNGGGSFMATVTGKYGIIPAFWAGYTTGWSGGEQGIDCLHEYNPNSAMATLLVNGRILRVEENGALLRVQGSSFNLHQRPVVVVGKDGLARGLTDAEATTLIDSLDDWFKTPELAAFPGANGAVKHKPRNAS